MKNTALAPRNGVVDHGISEAPDASWTPEDVNDWWTSLSPEEQQSVIDNHPEWIGNLNGIPMKARDQSNRKRLAEMKRKTEEQLRNTPSTTEVEDPQTGETYVIDNPEAGNLKEKLKDIEALEKSMNSEDSKNVGRTLLVLDDSSSDRLRAAVGSGDVDHADHVVTHTPGMDSRVSSTLATEDGGRGSGVAEVEDVLDESGRSWRANDTNRTGETVAGVTWLGYDAPQGIFEAGLSNRAADAGRDLANFQEGLQATHQGDPHLVSMDHSYGTLVGGYAGQLTDAVDDHIVAGSPGLRSYADSGFDIHGTTDASDLNALPGTLYAADANLDWVPASNVHGDNPANSGTFIKNYDTDFVALETGEEDGLKGVTGHEHYFERGSTPAHDMGKILVHEKPEHIADTSLNQPVDKRPWPK